MKKEIKLCTAIKDCLPLTLEVPFCSGCENKRMRSKVTFTARRIMSLSLSSKGDWRHPSRHCRSDLTQKNILLAKKKEKPLLSPPSNHIEQLKPKDSRYLGIQVSFFFYRWWRSAPIKQLELRKNFVFPSTLYSSFPYIPFVDAVNTLFFFQMNTCIC